VTQAIHNLRQRLLPLAGLYVIFATQAGCNTLLVYAERERTGNPIAELGQMERTLRGVALEKTELGGRQYLRVALPYARQSCQRTEPLELLLPVSDEAQYPAILRESALGAAVAPDSVPVYGTVARPLGLPEPTSLPYSEVIRQWLAGLDLRSNTISPIVIGSNMNNYGPNINVSYRLGGVDSKPHTTLIDFESDWVCRNRIKHGFMVLLYVPAAALDLLTSPVQLILFLNAH
jgi:hypothetical protein